MTDTGFRVARFSEDYKYIVDSNGRKVSLDDPSVVHVWAIDTSPYTSRLMTNVFHKLGWKTRITGRTTQEVLQYAKNLCSGRECLPCVSMIGATYRDIVENRGNNEISLYYNLDQEGPCQNGAWPIVWDTFARRLKKENIVFLANPGIRNNYISKGDSIAMELMTAVITGDIMDEAEASLLCLAKDKEHAMEIFKNETDRVVDAARNGRSAVKSCLRKWAVNLKKISLKADIRKTPRVLLFGGLNVMFVHYPISEYFIGEGIIPKIVDFAEGVLFLESEDLIRYGVKRGITDPKEQFKTSSILRSFFSPKNNLKEAYTTLRMRMHMTIIDRIQRNIRKIAEGSGLVFDRHIPFLDILCEGHKYVSISGFNETPVTVGRFVTSLKTNVYDGMINVGSFNCQPAMNSQAILRSLANKFEVPYTAIDCEGPSISANQRRLLETMSVQAKRVREHKNAFLH